MRIKDCFQCDKILIVFLVLIFFQIGIMISTIIDFPFKERHEIGDDKIIFFELIFELLIAFGIKEVLEKNSKSILDPMFRVFGRRPPEWIYMIITVSLILGMYQKLRKTNEKITYMYEKYVNSNNFIKRFMDWLKNK